jgi:hypothetical protein
MRNVTCSNMKKWIECGDEKGLLTILLSGLDTSLEKLEKDKVNDQSIRTLF